MNQQVTEIDLKDVRTEGAALRDDSGDLTTLESSIKQMGLLCPIVLDKDNILISGTRRLEACRRAGLERIPAIKLDVAHSSMEALSVQSDENLCRQSLSAAELERLIERKKSVAAGEDGSGSGLVAGIKKLFRQEQE